MKNQNVINLDEQKFLPLSIAILTISDSRGMKEDYSGNYLQNQVIAAGHEVNVREIVLDDIYQIRAVCSRWIADSEIEVIITTGGTGIAPRDRTPEAIMPLLDQTIEGFGELFRRISCDEFGLAGIQSRACGGVANRTMIFCLPGSPQACQTAWEHILCPQLDICTRPCNFVRNYFKIQ